ncbi:MAG: heterodisulfide reductase-related iron-sulfur binding cluster, partial [Candidatus Helarchaeales archaeon]
SSKLASEVLEKIGRKLDGKVRIKHVMEIILEDIGLEKIKQQATKSLNGLRLAAYHGCHLVRPSEIVKFDSPEIPTSIDKIIETFGGVSPDYEGKLDCCGGPLKLINDEISLDLLETKLKSMKRESIDAIILACPFCFFQFDFGQRELMREKGVKYNIPVITITQLIGLLIGLDPRLLGFNNHMIKTKSFLKKFDQLNESRKRDDDE